MTDWIDVKDESPKKSMLCWATIEKDGKREALFRVFDQFKNCFVVRDDSKDVLDEDGWIEDPTVVAWIELPTAYEG